MTPEYTRLDPALERAVTEIRDESVDPAVVEAAAARVWARLADEVAQASRAAQEHIRGCADFQALIPEYRAGRLPEARGLLLKDHLHQCVACRHVFEGKVVAFPAPRAAHRAGHPVRWAAAAVVVAAAGLSIWIAVDQYGARTGRAIVQSVNGTLYEVSAAGIRPLAPGQALPDGIEVRTAKDSDAMLELRDGSVVELRERSGLSATQMAGDVTVHLGRGSIIVQAARRRSGHLFVDTADCRVSVTGTVFSVSAGVKGSRISVVQGEVHVTQDNQEKILHPGDQAVTSPSLEPLPVKEDISWSRNRERLLQQLNSLRTGLEQLHLPALRYSSRLLERLPVSTVLYASIPNLGQYLGQAESVFREQTAGSPNLRALWAGHGFDVEAVLDKLRAASEYLGDEIAIVAFAGSNEKPLGPVFFAETRRDGFPEFLKKTGLPLTVDSRPGLVAFSPTPGAVEAFARVLNAPSGGFPGTPFYARIAESYRNGAGLLLCADLSRLAPSGPLTGVRYFIAEQKEVHGQMEASASLGFDGARTGIAAWLADPSPMGALDYVSPDASFAAAFVVKDPAAIVDFAVSTERRLAGGSAGEPSSTGPRDDLAGGLGGEFALAVDGSFMPVPSWKLVTEVYDPARFQATLMKLVESFNADAAKSGRKPLRTAQETADGRTYFMIGTGDLNPLTEAHYTISDGYLIAGPTRALVSRALQGKTAGTSLKHSSRFLELAPRDHNVHFSAMIYQNLGPALAPLISLFGTPGRGGQGNPLQSLGNAKPSLIAAYGEPDRISFATSGNVLGTGLSNLMSGNILGMAGLPLPSLQMHGTRAPRMPYR